MGKKRKIIAKYKKFGRKYANHPLAKKVAALRPTTAEAEPKPKKIVEAPAPAAPKAEPKVASTEQEKPKKPVVKKPVKTAKPKKSSSVVTPKTKPAND